MPPRSRPGSPHQPQPKRPKERPLYPDHWGGSRSASSPSASPSAAVSDRASGSSSVELLERASRRDRRPLGLLRHRLLLHLPGLPGRLRDLPRQPHLTLRLAAIFGGVWRVCIEEPAAGRRRTPPTAPTGRGGRRALRPGPGLHCLAGHPASCDLRAGAWPAVWR